LQQREFDLAERHGYGAVKHQRFVGTGYFDAVATVISSGQSSTCALAGSTEAEQFEKKPANGHAFANGSKNGHGSANGNGKSNGHAPAFLPHVAPAVFAGFDEDETALMPSGD
jgi:hypothetical protein